MHYAANECAMPIRLHCNKLRALCLTTNDICRTAEIGALLLKCVLIVYIWPEKGVLTANDPPRYTKEARKPHNSSRKRSTQTGNSQFRRYYHLPCWTDFAQILAQETEINSEQFWLKTRKSILNKVRKFRISTPNR